MRLAPHTNQDVYVHIDEHTCSFELVSYLPFGLVRAETVTKYYSASKLSTLTASSSIASWAVFSPAITD